MESLSTAFLRLVQPLTLDELLKGIDPTHLGSSENVLHFVHYCVGYVICLVVGIILLIFLMLLGCCLCCCRSNHSRPGGRVFRQQENIWMGSVLVMTILGLVLCSCVFQRNNAVGRETSAEYGVVQKMDEGLQMSERFKGDVIRQFNDSLHDRLGSSQRIILTVIRKLPKSAQDVADRKRQNMTGKLKQAGHTLNTIHSKLSLIEEKSCLFAKNVSALKTRVDPLKNTLNFAMISCGHAACLDVFGTVRENFTVSNIEQLKGLNVTKNALTHISYSDQSKTTLLALKKQSDQLIRTFVRGSNLLKHDVLLISRKTAVTFEGYISRARDIPLNKYKDAVHAFIPQFDFYGRIRYRLTMIVTTVTCIVLSLCLLGVLFAAINRESNLAHGVSQLLNFIVKCMFNISSAWLLVTMFMFLIGGLFRNEVCRYLTSEPEVENALPRVDAAMGQQIQQYMHSGLKLSLLNITKSCQANSPLYGALSLDNMGFGIDSLLSEGTHEMDHLLDQFKDHFKSAESQEKSYPRRSTNSPSWEKLLSQLKLDVFMRQLKRATIGLDLQKLSSDLKALKKTDQGTIRRLTDSLKDLNAQLTELQTLKDTLREAAHTLTIKINEFLLLNNQTKDKLNFADEQKELVYNTSALVLAAFDGFTRDFGKDVKTNIGKCRPLFNAGVTIVKPTCVNLVNPFNAIWFTFGTCLVVLLLLSVCGLNLASVYHSNRLTPVTLLRPRRLSTTPLICRLDRVAPEMFDVEEETVHTLNTRGIAAWNGASSDERMRKPFPF